MSHRDWDHQMGDHNKTIPKLDTGTLLSFSQKKVAQMSSTNETLIELPQFLGEHEANSKIKSLPSVRGAMIKQRGTHNLSSLLSTPIKCTLTLGELLKIRPHMWKDSSKTLNQLGILGVSGSQVNELKSNNE